MGLIAWLKGLFEEPEPEPEPEVEEEKLPPINFQHVKKVVKEHIQQCDKTVKKLRMQLHHYLDYKTPHKAKVASVAKALQKKSGQMLGHVDDLRSSMPERKELQELRGLLEKERRAWNDVHRISRTVSRSTNLENAVRYMDMQAEGVQQALLTLEETADTMRAAFLGERYIPVR